jgi:hypothetical protein
VVFFPAAVDSLMKVKLGDLRRHRLDQWTSTKLPPWLRELSLWSI